MSAQRRSRTALHRSLEAAAVLLAAVLSIVAAPWPPAAIAQTPSQCSVTLAVRPQPQAAGRPLMLVANATGCQNPKFEFYTLSRYLRREVPGNPPVTQLVQAFSDRSTASWTPDILPNTSFPAEVSVHSDNGDAGARTTFSVTNGGVDWGPLLPLVAVLAVGLALGAWQFARSPWPRGS